MPKDTTITSIIASGNLRQRFRVLTVDLDWPDGDPPYTDGSYVQVPSIPSTPPVYDPESFDAGEWTDVSALVSDYHYSEDGTTQCGQLTMTVPLGWADDLAAVFREMRVILIQEQYSDGTHATGWKNRCWCLSDGYVEAWIAGMLHSYMVNAKDALKLANIDVIGARTGSLVLQADLVRIGTYASKASMVLVNTATDAYEYAVTSDGTDAGAIHPNWSERPGPQFWCTNARDKDGNLVSDPVAISGRGVQAVFGSGILRVGKNYAHTSSASNGTSDFGVGLGIPEGTDPVIVGVLARFAHPADTTVTPNLPADVVDGLTVEDSDPGTVTLSEPIYSAGLTLVLRDGTGRRYQTVATHTTTATVSLTNSSITVPVDTPVSYGDANRLRDVLTRIFLECGYQMSDDAAPLYLNEPAVPVIAGAQRDIILPPQVYQDTDKLTHINAVARLRENGYIPPNYMVTADDSGQIYARSVLQRTVGNSETIPVTAIPITPGLQYERSDVNTFTRFIARGIARQVEDTTQRASVTIADVSAGNGGIPDATTYNYHGYGVTGRAVRSSPGANDYLFPLANILDRGIAPSVDITALAPWAWYIRYPKNWQYDVLQVANEWADHALCEITLPEPARIEAVEFHTPNTWTESWGWGQSNRRGGNSGGQSIGLDYYDSDQSAWMPMVSNATSAAEPGAIIRVTSDAFDSRTAVTAERFRVICRRAFTGTNFTRDEWYDHFVVAIWLSQVKLWGAQEIRGVAELGNPANYNSEMSSAAWLAVRDRLRSRTDILPDAVPWIDTQEYADWLALEWLKERSKDLAPRQLAVIRPDVRLWDTIAFTDPLGNTASYLVSRTDHTSDMKAQTAAQVVNYLAPYEE